MNPNPIDTFLLEAEDLLVQIEDVAVDIDVSSPDSEAINSLFRAFHTIKGSGAMFGFDAVAGFTHHLETALDAVRNGKLPMSGDLLALILRAKDHIKGLLDSGKRIKPELERSGEQITAALEAFLHSVNTPAPGSAPHAQTPSQGAAGQQENDLQTWEILFRPSRTLMACGTNPVVLLNELRDLGECTVVADTGSVPLLSDLSPDHLYLSWRIKLQTQRGRAAIQDIFIFVEDECELSISLLSTGEESSTPEVTQVEQRAVQREAPKETEARKSRPKDSTVRVASDKLDRLVNLVGELVMNQSRLKQAASHAEVPGLAEPVEEIERLVSELRENVLGIRMMPIGTTFTRFKRLVHDLAAELGKQVELVTEGADTELDKTVLDQLGDPLVHLIRNSMDHGIETVEDRLAAGKPAHGTLRLSAVHTGSNVIVSIEDDGRGLNTARIQAKAIERGLIRADATLSEKEIFNLIFEPGFSTASQITSVSGRGVGMDVVKKQVEQLRGSITLASEPGQGTRLSLTLPLTLAIIDGLLVSIGRDQFILPMSAVSENVELQRHERMRNNGRNLIRVRGELVPYIQLRDHFQITETRPDVEKIVIVQHAGERVGLLVDRVLGNHQTVIQSLGKFYSSIELFSGATIMGDGRVGLILDPVGLVRHIDQLETLKRAS